MLSPVQVEILPISDDFNDYAYEVKNILKRKSIRVEVDDRSEKLGYKIREAYSKKIPYSLIVGEKEVVERSVSVRGRGQQEQRFMDLDEFVEIIIEEIESKKINK